MSEPVWVTKNDILAIHNRQLAEHAGGEGLRDENLLDSAIERPRFKWAYSEPWPDLSTLAAALAFGIITNHPFVDGNKRSGYVACRLFLLLNNADFAATSDDKYLTFYALAAGERTEEGCASWIRSRIS